jgi:hypothetical protein
LSERQRNLRQHSLEILEHLDIPESQHAEAARFEQRSTSRVGFHLIHVLSAVELDHQPPLAAAEVGDEIADRELAVELGGEKTMGARVPP